MKYPLEIFFSKIICFFIGHVKSETKYTTECLRCWKIFEIKQQPYIESIFEKHHFQ